MRQPRLNHPGLSLIWFALLLLGIIFLLLTNSRAQLHRQIIDSEARFLKTNFSQKFEEFFLEELAKDPFEGKSIEQLDQWFDIRSLISRTALSLCHSLRYLEYNPMTNTLIPKTYPPRPSLLYHPTKIFSIPKKEAGQCANFPINPESLLVEVELDNQPHFIEFTLSK